MTAQWSLLASDFASEYGIRLATAGMSWPEFSSLLTGLFAADTRLARHFAPRQEEPDGS